MRIGIVGAGFMASTHAAGWTETPAEIAGFVHRTEEGARPLASQYGAQAYPDLDAMLADVDVVDICTPTHLHYEKVLQAAAAGKDIVCEKPLARTLEQGQAMIAACRNVGVKLLVAHVVRFFPEYALAKAAIDRGEIGQPAVVRIARESSGPMNVMDTWFGDLEKSGGMILDLMIHDFDYARWVAGEVATVFAKSIQASHNGAARDHGLAILTHRNGAICHVAGSWALPPPEFHTRFEIAGTEGLIEFDSEATKPIHAYLFGGEVGELADVPVPGSPLNESPYTTEIKAFYEALAHDAPLPVTAEDGLAALQIALAALESAHSGAVVSLAPLPEVPA
jgi:predicted dehydrogenase